mgnify:FL=1
MFIWSALAHLVALTSPGPDTAIVIRQVSLYGKNEGIKTSIGIGIGIYIHCLLAVNGISILILANEIYKFLITFIGGIYITYLGVNIVINKSIETFNFDHPVPKYKSSLFIGFFTNLFNIKAFLFFISIFSILIEESIGIFIHIYPIYFAVVSSAWFIFISYIFTVFRNQLSYNISRIIQYIMSLMLCAIGISILFKSIYEYF